MEEGLIYLLNRKTESGKNIGYKISHDGKDDWTKQGIEDHVRGNGHSKIDVRVAADPKFYWECFDLSNRLEAYNKPKKI